VKVVAATEPEMRRRTEAKGFVLLGWGYGGTVHFFSKKPVRTLDELKAVKMFASAGDDAWVTWWKNNGFHPVPLAATDILTGLQTGMIDGLPTTPLAALALQWFRQAPFMLDLPIAPLLGATVMPRKTWDRLSEADRAAVVAAARRVEQRLFAEVPKQDRAAVDEMAKRGLTVVRITPAEQAAWKTQAETFMATLRGMIDPAAFDLVHKERDAARRGR